MTQSSNQRSADFLQIADQFKLGALVTESSHPVTANLSEVAKHDISAALGLLFEVDGDVVRKYREFAESGRAEAIARSVVESLRAGGKLFFTGCGSTGRLSIQLVSIWRDFWQRQRPTLGRDFKSLPNVKNLGPDSSQAPKEVPLFAGDFLSNATAPPVRSVAQNDTELAPTMENRAFSVMAGGDFALIKSVEGFEDFTEFGKRQIGDLGIAAGDVVFAITEGGETSFVIGTAWQGVEVGAKVYFVYNNPDDILVEHVQRSREVIQDPRIEKINLTTGPMAITGSTRMQATTIQLCVLLTILEMVVRSLLPNSQLPTPNPHSVPSQFLSALIEMHASLRSRDLLAQLARLVAMEESVYRHGHKNNYFADRLGIDVLTDTTERSPTYCTPPFRKFDDATAGESWSFLYVPYPDSPSAWRHILKRDPKCVDWSEPDVRAMVGDERAERQHEIVRHIGAEELMRFRIGLDGLSDRPLGPGDSAVGVVDESEKASLMAPDGFHRARLKSARASRARTGLIYFGREESVDTVFRDLSGAEIPKHCVDLSGASRNGNPETPSEGWNPECISVLVPVPETGFLLDGVTRAGVKMLLNALSTCTMVRLGRVMGNYMVWLVASNLKLIDRATRYIEKLAGLEYVEANRLLFEVIEYVEPRMKADQAYPPVVGLAVTRVQHGIGNEEAERRLLSS